MTFIEEPKIRLANSPAVDAAARLRVSNNHILFSGQLVHADNPLVWDTKVIGGGTAVYNVNESTLTLNVGTASGDRAIRQSKRSWLYRAGQSQNPTMTAALLTPVANILKQFGLFDALDGLFFEVNGTTDIAFTRRSFVTGVAVDDRKVRADWSEDKLDGSGPSGITLNLANAQRMVVDLLWHGVGRIRVGFNFGGDIVYAHEFNFANELADVPYMRTASLPIRYEITNTGPSVGGSLKQMCASVSREGGSEEEGFPSCLHSDVSGVGVLDATQTPRTAISVRLRNSHMRAFLKPLGAGILNLGNAAIVIKVVINPTLVGGPLGFVDDGAGLQVSFDQLEHTVGSGHSIACGSAPGAGPSDTVGALSMLESVLGVASNIDGVSDILSLIVEAAAGTQNLIGFLQMLELF